MKVAIVRQRYNPYGGAERIVARVLPALERAGAEALISRADKGWGARRVLRVDPFHIGNLWRDWSFARGARKAWSREGFDIVQSHERIPGCDVYRAGDGCIDAGSNCGARPPASLRGSALRSIPTMLVVCEAEKRMFEHPRRAQ